ncbi:glycoside hydrolase family 16 protein [Jaapia argillacea MUCL 33604]|uniref:Glycoside hydrolase family 16 protein n=1 Tax=Jaapia argillacea MUCL 33604 TaxID=933084 RepID=A0A067Q385_9AGAM|nr:glycoside hydrolase family 16 protein [Jaapia argillacea MUCL 33604]
MYQGQNFFDGWDFFTGQDPTHGTVQFLSQQDAATAGLAFVQGDGTVVVGVDNTTVLPVGTPRQSVRISTTKTYNKGLFIADFSAMPHGCSVWPAWWSVGPNWPQGGEFDVVEGVHNQATNQYTLHTSDGCTLDTAVQAANEAFTGQVLGTECASSGGDNAGCGILDTDTTSYGHGFNIIDGGVFAHLWDETGVKMWHFTRADIPQDLTAQNPNPSSWPTPSASWSSSTCSMDDHFFDHSLVLDITLCGDFAGPTYASSGCPGTCATAVADPTNFDFARFIINYVAVYN